MAGEGGGNGETLPSTHFAQRLIFSLPKLTRLGEPARRLNIKFFQIYTIAHELQLYSCWEKIKSLSLRTESSIKDITVTSFQNAQFCLLHGRLDFNPFLDEQN